MKFAELAAKFNAISVCGAVDIGPVNVGRIDAEGNVVFHDAGKAHVEKLLEEAAGPQVAPDVQVPVAPKKRAASKTVKAAEPESDELTDDLGSVLGDLWVIVHQPAQEIANWVCALRGVTAPAVDAAIAFRQDGLYWAGVYFDCMTDNNVFAHIGSRVHTLPRSLLTAVARYVFETAGLERMTFAVPSSNRELIRLVYGFGAEQEGRLSRACGVDDLLLFVLWRDTPFASNLLERYRG